MAVWAEAATGATESPVLLGLQMTHGLRDLVCLGQAAESSTPAQLPEAGVSQQWVVRSPKWVIEELAFC